MHVALFPHVASHPPLLPPSLLCPSQTERSPFSVPLPRSAPPPLRTCEQAEERTSKRHERLDTFQAALLCSVPSSPSEQWGGGARAILSSRPAMTLARPFYPFLSMRPFPVEHPRSGCRLHESQRAHHLSLHRAWSPSAGTLPRSTLQTMLSSPPTENRFPP